MSPAARWTRRSTDGVHARRCCSSARSARQTLKRGEPRGADVYTTRLEARLGDENVEVSAEAVGLEESLAAAASAMRAAREARGLPPTVVTRGFPRLLPWKRS